MTTDAPPVTLAEFLLARYDEEEQKANGWRRVRSGAHIPNIVSDMHGRWATWDDPADPVARRFEITPEMEAEWYEPAPDTRVLADLEAKRRIVELHALVSADYRHGWWVSDGTPATELTPTGCNNCRSCGVDGEQYVEDGPCETLRLLALPYAAHEHYREEWKP